MELKCFDKTLDWSDARFYGFAWRNDGKDIELFLSHANENISSLLCAWASNLIIDLQWQNSSNLVGANSAKIGGPLLTVSASLESMKENQFSVRLNFGTTGYLSFECQTINVL